EDGIRDFHVTGVQTCALPIFSGASFSFAESLLGSVISVCSSEVGFRVRQYFLYTQGVSAIECAIAAFQDGDAAHVCGDGGVDFDGQDVVHLQLHQFGDTGLYLRKFGHQLDVGATHLARKLIDPALVYGFHAGFLQRARQQVAYRLDHRVGQADIEVAARRAQFDVEGRYHHDFVAAGDAGKLGVHFGADVFELHRVNLLPRS